MPERVGGYGHGWRPSPYSKRSYEDFVRELQKTQELAKKRAMTKMVQAGQEQAAQGLTDSLQTVIPQGYDPSQSLKTSADDERPTWYEDLATITPIGLATHAAGWFLDKTGVRRTPEGEVSNAYTQGKTYSTNPMYASGRTLKRWMDVAGATSGFIQSSAGGVDESLEGWKGAGFQALTPGMSPWRALNMLGGEEEAIRRERDMEAWEAFKRGDISLKDLFETARQTQSERPWWMQLVNESISPTGMIENVVGAKLIKPVGLVAKKAGIWIPGNAAQNNAALKAAQKTEETRKAWWNEYAMALPNVEELSDIKYLDNATQVANASVLHLKVVSPVSRLIQRVTNPNSLRNPLDNAGDRITVMRNILPSSIQTATLGTLAKISKNGKLKDIFEIGSKGENFAVKSPALALLRSTKFGAAKTGERQKMVLETGTFNEIVEIWGTKAPNKETPSWNALSKSTQERILANREKRPLLEKALTDDQKQYLSRLDASMHALLDMADEAGAKVWITKAGDEKATLVSIMELKDRVPGGYFPQLYKRVDELADIAKGKPKDGTFVYGVQNPHSLDRHFEFIEDAIGANMTPINPENALESVVKSIYHEVGEVHMENVIRRYSHTLDELVSPHLQGEVVRASAKLGTIQERIKRLEVVAKALSEKSPGFAARVKGEPLVPKGERITSAGGVYSGFRGDPVRMVQRPDIADEVNIILNDSVMVDEIDTDVWHKLLGALDESDAKDAGNKFRSAIRDLTKRANEQDRVVRMAKRAISDEKATMRAERGELQLKINLRDGTERFWNQDDIMKGWIPDEVINDYDIQRRLLGATQLADAKKAWDITVKGMPAEAKTGFRSVMASGYGRVTENIEGLNGIMRSLKSAYDLGTMNIHLLPLLFTRPDVWGPSVKAGLQGFTDEKFAFKFMNEHMGAYERLAATGQLGPVNVEYVQDLGRLGGMLREDVPEKLGYAPGLTQASERLGRATQAFERSYTGMLLAAKLLTFEAMEGSVRAHADDLVANGKFLDIVKRVGQSRAPAEITQDASAFARSRQGQAIINQYVDTEVAQHIAKLTGSMDLAGSGMSKSVQSTLGAFVFFAPRYRLSSYAMVIDATRGGVRGDLARKALGNFMLSGLLTYAAIGMRIGQEPNLDPTQGGKFLTYKVNGVNVGFGGAYMAMGRIASNLFRNVDDAVEGDDSWLTVMNPTDRDSWLQKMIRSQASPVSGAAWSVFSGNTYIGEPVEGLKGFGEVVARSGIPFWADSYFDTPGGGVTGMVTEFTGFRTFPVSGWERSVDMINLLIAKDEQFLDENGNPTEWDDLTKLQRARARNMYPLIDAQMIETERVWNKRQMGDDKLVSDYRQELNTIRRKHVDLIKSLNEDLRMGDISTREYRDRRSKAMDVRSVEYINTRNDHKEADELMRTIYEEDLSDLKSEKQVEHVGDLAYLDFLVRVTLNNQINKPFDEYDYDKAREETEKFIEEWGMDNYQYVLSRQKVSYENMPLENELREGTKAFKPYFTVGEAILTRLGRTSDLQVWKAYKKARAMKERGVIIQRDFLVEAPWIADVEKAESKVRKLMRERNATLERWLYKWGYIDPTFPAESFVNPENRLIASSPEAIEAMGSAVYPISEEEMKESISTSLTPTEIVGRL